MKAWDEINVEEKLSFEEFFTLFAAKLPLVEEEKKELFNYYKMYEVFVAAEVKPIDAWVSIRNVFAFKNSQIAERIKANALTL